MKYSLRGLLIVAAVAPPMLAVVCLLVYAVLIWPFQSPNYDLIPQPALLVQGESAKQWHEQNDELVKRMEHEQHLAGMGNLTRFSTIFGALVLSLLSLLAIAFMVIRRRWSLPTSSSPTPNSPKP
jgi:hypothetical protein